MAKYSNPSGFPEHLPEILSEELRIRDIMRRVYESFGYVPLETASVEYMDTLASKGEIAKEIYRIDRALAETSSESDRALRFDLTVPLARYVAQHFGQLQFPFKRWQIQRVWRGDRPQAGRFREFYQADIDVIGNEKLPIHFDAEVVLMVKQVLEEIGFGSFTISLNHRKFLQGLLEHYGFNSNSDSEEATSLQMALRAIDKFDKIGRTKTVQALVQIGINRGKAEELMSLLEKNIPIDELDEFLNQFNIESELFKEGVSELQEVSSLISSSENSESSGAIIFSPRIARGLDYYTGSVYETTIDGLERYGSICSGGRYADLAGKFSKKHLPGVGISIGLSRLMHILKDEKLLNTSKKSPTNVYVALLREEQRIRANQVAAALRDAGLNTEVAHDGNRKLSKQFKYANSIGVEHVVVMNEGGDNHGTFNVKSMSDGTNHVRESVSQLISSLLDDEANKH